MKKYYLINLVHSKIWNRKLLDFWLPLLIHIINYVILENQVVYLLFLKHNSYYIVKDYNRDNCDC